MQYIWPDSILNPPRSAKEYQPDMPSDKRRLAALGDQLCAWAGCEIGNTPPQYSGEAMAKLSQISGALTPDQCMTLSSELLAASKKSTART